MNTLSEKIDFHVKKAEKALATAIANHEREDYDSVANRGYYCVFYCEKALLFSRDIAGESHRHVHNEFNREFVKNGIFEQETSKIIQGLMEIRHEGDYGEEIGLSEEEAVFALSEAQKFLEKTKAYLNSLQDKQTS